MDDSTREEIGKALGRVPSGLFIVSSTFEDRSEGMLGSWIMQAAFEPPMITLALARNRGLRLLVESSEAFAVSVLGEGDGALMKPFFKAPGPDEDQFADVESETCQAAGGAPVLLGGLAWLGCRLRDSMVAGDNVVYLGEVVAGKRLKDGDPKTHVRKSGFSY